MVQGHDIAQVGLADAEEAIDTLAEAFRDYPVFRYVLKDAGKDHEPHLRAMVEHFTAARIREGYPVLALRVAGRIVGAANVRPPGPPPSERWRESWRGVVERIGPAAEARFQAYATSCRQALPEGPVHDLGMIGLRPSHQGRGLARPLIEAVHELAEKEPESRGVVLNTEKPENLGFYERFGYEVLTHERIEELETWLLFRPK